MTGERRRRAHVVTSRLAVFTLGTQPDGGQPLPDSY
jgi:hypothetical protein